MLMVGVKVCGRSEEPRQPHGTVSCLCPTQRWIPGAYDKCPMHLAQVEPDLEDTEGPLRPFLSSQSITLF